MVIIPWERLCRGTCEAGQPIALTIGVFDGIHIGHQRLLAEVVHNNLGAQPVVCSFLRNPGEVLGTRPSAGSILSDRQKIGKFERLGVAQLVLIDFSPEIGKLSAEDFLAVFERSFELRKLVVGYNFRLGRDRSAGIQELVSRYSPSETELTVIPAAHYRDQAVSSSRIREAIREGRFEDTRRMLNEPYCLDLEGQVLQREGGWTVLARSRIAQVLPREGTYRAAVRSPLGEKPVEVRIEDQRLAWKSDPGFHETEICFIGG